MTFRERIVKTFEHKKIDRIVWQPRIEHWYNWNKKMGRLPEKYKNKSLLEIYDDLGTSVRYPRGSLLKISYKKTKVKQIGSTSSGITTIFETPIGNLKQTMKFGEQGTSSYYSEHLIKDLEEIKIMEYILTDAEYEFDINAFWRAEKKIGDMGVTQFFYPRAPLQRLIIDYMGFENTIYALHDYPQKIEKFLRAIEESDDRMYEILLESPVKILNFGENIDANLNSPVLFKKYLIPYYKKRVAQIHQSGKFCHIHLDGSLKALLPLLKENEAGFDGYEACTPLPQGDITLEELKDTLGNTIILLDGIPAILFLPSYSYQELEKFAIKILGTFSPNLILGISDEISPSGDIERVRFISKIVEKLRG